MARAALAVFVVVVAATAVAVSAASSTRDTSVTVGVVQTARGRMLVDGRGRALYLFSAERRARILCTSDYLGCTTLWPPLLTQGAPHAGAGVNPRLLGMVRRTKPAGWQVTYNGHPLYRYSRDTKPGESNGQGLYALWFVVSAAGQSILE